MPAAEGAPAEETLTIAGTPATLEAATEGSQAIVTAPSGIPAIAETHCKIRVASNSRHTPTTAGMPTTECASSSRDASSIRDASNISDTSNSREAINSKKFTHKSFNRKQFW